MSARVPKSRKKNHTTSLTLAPPQYGLYMRVSTEDQADRGTIEAQREFLQNYVQLYQLPVFREYADDGVTGTIPLGERPEGKRLLEDAEAGHVQVVLVYRVTRLGRSLGVLMDAHEQLSALDVTFRSAMEPFDTGSAVGRFFFQLLGSMAELDRSLTLEQLTRGRDRRVRDGHWTDGLVPYGYVLDLEKRLTPSDRLVEVLQMTEARVVHGLFERIAGGSSAKAEAERWTALGVPTTRYYSNGRQQAGGRKWYPHAIVSIVQATTYKGEHIFRSQHGTIRRTVPPLVDPLLWEAANVQLQKNRRLPKGNQTRTYLLRGLITCGQCKAHYVGQAMGTTERRPRVYYRCNAHAAAGYAARARCTSPAVQAAWLEQEIWGDCAEYIRNPAQALAEAQRQLQERTQRVAGHEETRAQLTRALVEKAREREDILVLYRRKSLGLDDTEAALAAIAREEAALRQELATLETADTVAQAFATEFTEARALLERLRGNLEAIERINDWAAKRAVVEALVQGIAIEVQPDGEVCAHVRYRFGRPRVAKNASASSPDMCYTLTRVVSTSHKRV